MVDAFIKWHLRGGVLHPNFSGTTLASSVVPPPQWVVISGHSEFEQDVFTRDETYSKYVRFTTWTELETTLETSEVGCDYIAISTDVNSVPGLTFKRMYSLVEHGARLVFQST